MRDKWIKRFFPIFALLLLAPWLVAYAHTYTDDMAGQDTVRARQIQSNHDGGSFYCTTTNNDSGSLSPQFYLEVDQINGSE